MKIFWANGVALSAITKKKKFKATPSPGKVMIAVFWDNDGVILVNVMAIGETINSGAHIKTLQKLKERYRRVRPHRIPGSILIQHDNIRPHTSLRTQEAIANLVGMCSPHIPDLAPSDFHRFGSLKDALSGTSFEDDDGVIRAVKTWQFEQETSWYRKSMRALVSRWRKAVDLGGDYMEK